MDVPRDKDLDGDVQTTADLLVARLTALVGDENVGYTQMEMVSLICV